MKIKDLIELLSRYDPEDKVFYTDTRTSWHYPNPIPLPVESVVLDDKKVILK